MKTFLFILIFLSVILAFPRTASAHLPGQQPFFKMDGKYSGFYPVYSTSIAEVPQDLAPETYLVNQPINFEIDTVQLPVPVDIVNDTKFLWDFGDGTKAQGLRNTHAYTKMGSYVVTIYTDTSAVEKNVAPQLLQSTMVHILPTKDYKLPKAVIKLNGKSVKDPIIDTFTLPYGGQFSFDGASSITPSSKIVSYSWDFGDGKGSKDKITTHTYAKDLRMMFPTLRVIDKNGFISDNFVQIDNELFKTGTNPLGKNKPKQQAKSTKTPSQLPYTLTAGAGLVILALGISWLKKRGKGERKFF